MLTRRAHREGGVHHQLSDRYATGRGMRERNTDAMVHRSDHPILDTLKAGHESMDKHGMD